MRDRSEEAPQNKDSGDTAPGDEQINLTEPGSGLSSYVLGLVLSAGLTAASFWVLRSSVIWAPAIPAALVALAIAQMGVHLVFFLHITTGPDNTNNVLALGFGVLIVGLVLIGSMWIMSHLNHQNMPMQQAVQKFR